MIASLTARSLEIAEKLQRLRAQMVAREIDSLHVTQAPNIAWLTAGASTAINLASDIVPVSLLITHTNAYAITIDIEAPRLEQEEFLPELGFSMVVESWHQAGGAALNTLINTAHHSQDGSGAGIDFSAELQALRVHLQPQEIVRLRHVGALAGAAINEVMLAITPGMTENTIAKKLAATSRARGGLAVVNLVASDDRIIRFRHPLPTDKLVERYVMVVLCLRFMGLIAAVTRFVHFGQLPDELAAKTQAVATIDAKLIQHTRAGVSLGEMFAFAQQAYSEAGYPDEIWKHHQGGSLAYQPREILMRPNEPTVIAMNQAFAWNPSIPGVKSEDTIILSESGQEIITATAGWPTLAIEYDGQTILRPAIKVM